MNNGSKSPSPTQGKPIRCRAAVCGRPGEPLLIEEIEVDPPKIGEVRIKILCTSLCHSDVTVWNMRQELFSFPIIFGHEAVGIVESVGRSEGSERRGNGVACVSNKLQRMQRVQEFEEQQMQCFWGQIWDRNAKRWHKQI
ncbi:unnamed protein product [Citrullus colocynthis]|uniref:Alcohol dehydrogenase-like N-terminal domain-containing protein n=1 Tax=Citrullus colocynthis TaxID=252529 RepID=A0ABP0Y2U8_9ROSI